MGIRGSWGWSVRASDGVGYAVTTGQGDDVRCTVGERPFQPLRDDQWAKVAPLVGAGKTRGGAPVDLRKIVDGIRWVLERGAKWREVPEGYGAPTTCWRWHKRWVEDGTWQRITRALWQ